MCKNQFRCLYVFACLAILKEDKKFHSMKNKIQSSLDEIRKILRRGSGGRLGNKIHFTYLKNWFCNRIKS